MFSLIKIYIFMLRLNLEYLENSLKGFSKPITGNI